MKNTWIGRGLAIVAVCAMVTILVIVTKSMLPLWGLLAIPCIGGND
jgi:peptidoglycan/LPS O-acetylase OafA/YrhL